MAGSTKPRRRKASAPALRYERRPGKPGSAARAEQKSEWAFGCLLFLGFAAIIVLLAVLDRLCGDGTWQWAAKSWPGGAYGFAGCVGVAGPCVLVLSLFCLSRMRWRSWREHPGSTVLSTGAAIASLAALVPYVALVSHAQNTGKWGKGRDTPPSWVFRNFPWLWAVGLLGTVVAMAALACALVIHNRRQRTP